MSGDRLADVLTEAIGYIKPTEGLIGSGHSKMLAQYQGGLYAAAIRAALASGDLSPEDLGMVYDGSWAHHPIDDHAECPVSSEFGCYRVHYEEEGERTANGVDLYHAPTPSAPEPGSSDTSREAPAPSLRCAPSPGTSDGPRPVAEAP